MEIPRYWVKLEGEARRPDGVDVPIIVWNWSASSEEQARARARDGLARMTARIVAGDDFPERYAYDVRPMREEILRELPDRKGAPSVVLTRNAYGAVVLNAASTMFVDVDDVAPRRGLVAGIRALFARSKDPIAPSDPALELARALVAAEPQISLRVYRTAAGHRILFTNDVFDPKGGRAHAIMERLSADPRYRQLCRAQGCFRARLTPKPWRIGLRNPPRRDPWKDPDTEAEMGAWIDEYDRVGSPFGVCRLVLSLGSGVVHPDVAPVIALHDEFVLRGSGGSNDAAPPLA